MKESNSLPLLCDEMSDEIIATAERLVKANGTQGITVRKILKEMDISNRVFYNRFHNIDEVLQTVYINSVMQMRKNIPVSVPEDADFFEFTMQLALKCLDDTYELLQQFSRYTFEHYSLSEDNRKWWTENIRRLFEYAKNKGLIKPELDCDALSYFTWCVCRGLNSDAVTRNFSKKEAAEYLKAGFSCFIDGLKNNQL